MWEEYMMPPLYVRDYDWWLMLGATIITPLAGLFIQVSDITYVFDMWDG